MVTKTLPFKYKPIGEQTVEVGEPSCGIIEIPRYDDITPAEKIFIDKETKDMPDTTEALCRFIDEVARETGKPKKEIWKMVQNNDVLELMDASPKGLIELRKIQEQVDSIKRVIIAVAILKHRVKGCEDITVKDALDPQFMPAKLLRHIEEFYQKEVAGWPSPDETQNPLINDDMELKKISPEVTPTK